MKAADVKEALRRRHPAFDTGMVGQWTCIEEWDNIDLLAFNAWASSGPRYGLVGYEIKVSRADYKRELLNPGKRAAGVSLCHDFYFAIPQGLLKDDEIDWKEPPGFAERDPFARIRCPGAFGTYCLDGRAKFGTVDRRTETQRQRGHWGYLARDLVDYARTYDGPCPTCRGVGWIAESPVVRAGAPKLWVPADVGLIEVSEGGCRIRKKAPRREPREFNVLHLTRLVRFVSTHPDPRHLKLNRAA